MRRFGAQIMWLVVLCVFTVIMGVLLISGDILLYLAPRMVPMVWLGFVVLAALSVYQLFQVKQCERQAHREKTIRLYSLVFLIPVILIITVTPSESTSGTLPNKNVQMLSLSPGDTSDADAADDTVSPDAQQSATPLDTPLPTKSPRPSSEIVQQGEENTEEAEEDMESSADTIEAADAAPCVFSDETVPFDASADLFSDYIYDTVEELDGEIITLYGFVHIDDSFPDNTILVSRLYIYCCAADASIVGFHVKVEDLEDFKTDEWICVTGTVQAVSLEYYGDYYDFPILTDGVISHCVIPNAQEAYIYP